MKRLTAREANAISAFVHVNDDGFLRGDWLISYTEQVLAGVKPASAAVLALESCGVDADDLERDLAVME